MLVGYEMYLEIKDNWIFIIQIDGEGAKPDNSKFTDATYVCTNNISWGFFFLHPER